MARNDVKVSFVGDSSDLEKAADRAAQSVEGAGKAAADAGQKMGRFADGFGGVRDGADDTERRIVGFRDSLTGTQDVMKGLRDGDMVTLATGFADLASSVANLGADMLEWGKKAFEAGRQVAAAHASSVAAKAKDIASSVAHRAASVASTVATQAQAAAQWVLNAAMSANPVMLVVIAITALIAGLVLAYQHSESFREIVDRVGSALRDGFMAAVNAVINVLEGIADTISNVVGWFRDLPGRVFGAMSALAERVGTAIRNATTSAVDAVTGLASRIVNGLWDAIVSTWEAVWKFSGWLHDKIADAVDAAVDAVTGVADRIVSGLWDAIVAAWDLYWRLGGFLREKIEEGIEAVGDLGEALLDKGRELIRGMERGIRDAWDAVVEFVGGIDNRIKNAIGDLSHLLWDVGRAIFRSLWDGMKDVWNDVTGWLGGIGGAIKSLKGPIEADRVLLRPEGAAIMEGLYVGMNNEWDDTVAPFLDGLAPEISTEMDAVAQIVTRSFDQMTDAAQARLAQLRQIAVNSGLDPSIIPDSLGRVTDQFSNGTPPALPPAPSPDSSVVTAGAGSVMNVYVGSVASLSDAALFGQTIARAQMASSLALAARSTR